MIDLTCFFVRYRLKRRNHSHEPLIEQSETDSVIKVNCWRLKPFGSSFLLPHEVEFLCGANGTRKRQEHAILFLFFVLRGRNLTRKSLNFFSLFIQPMWTSHKTFFLFCPQPQFYDFKKLQFGIFHYVAFEFEIVIKTALIRGKLTTFC